MSYDNEIWKDIKGYEGLYQVSNMGRVKSFNYRNSGKIRILKGVYNRYGYLTVQLSKNKVGKRKLIHRLVLSAFCPVSGMDELDVNHKDEKWDNNVIGNLEWCTKKYNNNYGNHAKNMSKAKSIPVICLTTGKEFKSIKDASCFYNISYRSLCMHLRGKTKSCGKMIWKYKNN